MIFYTKGFVTDVTEVVSKKGNKFLNAKLKSSSYDMQYLSVGVKVDNLPVDTPLNLTVDVSTSWSQDEKKLFTHVVIVGFDK